MLKEYREFIKRGNVIDMAVGIIIGAAFGTIVRSFVDDIIMPPIGLMLGNMDFTNLFVVLKQGVENPGPYMTPAEAKAAGAVTFNYGTFINTLITFFIVSLAVFFLVRTVNRMKSEKEVEKAEPTVKDCYYCRSTIPISAIRCPHCTSDLSGVK